MIKFKTLTNSILKIHGLSVNSSDEDFDRFLHRYQKRIKVNRYSTFVDVAFKTV